MKKNWWVIRGGKKEYDNPINYLNCEPQKADLINVHLNFFHFSLVRAINIYVLQSYN